MPNRRFDWHEHIKDIEGEYRAARVAVDRLKSELTRTPDILSHDQRTRTYLTDADTNLEGTYLVRLFAAFEAALRSYDRARHHDLSRNLDAAVLIDSIGGRRGQGISAAVRAGAHAVRQVRNFLGPTKMTRFPCHSPWRRPALDFRRFSPGCLLNGKTIAE